MKKYIKKTSVRYKFNQIIFVTVQINFNQCIHNWYISISDKNISIIYLFHCEGMRRVIEEIQQNQFFMKKWIRLSTEISYWIVISLHWLIMIDIKEINLPLWIFIWISVTRLIKKIFNRMITFVKFIYIFFIPTYNFVYEMRLFSNHI